MGASAKIVLFKGKLYKDKTHPVYLQVTINRKNKYYSLGNSFKCKPDQWIAGERLFDKSFPNYKRANRNIQSAIADASKILIDLEENKPHFTQDDFSRKYSKDTTKLFLLAYMDKIIGRLKHAGRIGNATTYETAKNQFEKFFKKDIELTTISKKHLQLFLEQCQSKQLKPGTISNYLRTLRAVFNKARKEEDLNYYPFEGFNWKQLNHKTSKRAISKDEILSILNFDTEPGTHLFDTKQMFSFMYLCYGLNFADLAKIEESNLIFSKELAVLIYDRSKGGKLYEIPLNDSAIKILKYYLNRRDNKYVFPILNEHIHVTPTQIKTRIKTELKYFNSDLKSIASELDIKEKVTSYTARHTFASVLAKAGTNPFVIGDMMGHSDLKTTQIYLKELDHSERIEASKKLI